MRFSKGLAIAAICFFMASASQGEEPGIESALRGADLSRHISGPEVTIESVKGKVVLFEYGGPN